MGVALPDTANVTTSWAPAPPVPTQPPPPPPPMSVACTAVHSGGAVHETPLEDGKMKNEAGVPVCVDVGIEEEVIVEDCERVNACDDVCEGVCDGVAASEADAPWESVCERV